MLITDDQNDLRHAFERHLVEGLPLLADLCNVVFVARDKLHLVTGGAEAHDGVQPGNQPLLPGMEGILLLLKTQGGQSAGKRLV